MYQSTDGQKRYSLFIKVNSMMKQATCITTSARMFAVFPCTRHYTGVSLLTLSLYVRTLYLKSARTTTLYSPLSGTTRMSQHQKKHSPTHLSWLSTNLYQLFNLPRSTASSLLRAWQSFCTLLSISISYLVYLLLWSPPPHTPYISSPNQCLLFATHADTTEGCFAAVPFTHSSIPSLSLNSLLGTFNFYLNITHPSDHSHLCLLKCHLIFFPDRPGLTSM